MKIYHWLAVIGALYFATTGAISVYNANSSSSSLSFPLPDWGSVMGDPNTNTAGALDLGTAAVIYFFVLHKKLMG